MDRGLIFHLAVASEWEAAVDDGVYRISTLGLGLDEVGYIHCSYAEQIDQTASEFYADRDDVIVLSIDPTLLDAEIRVEDGFPHIYGPLPVAAVVEVRPLNPE